jgi:AraC-like DNA-binding protein
LTFDYNAVCKPLHAFETSYTTETALGEDGTLCVALLTAGCCRVMPAGLVAVTGSLLVAPGAVAIAPQKSCALTGVVLAGNAVAELCTGLPLPVVLPVSATPKAPELLYRLAVEPDEMQGSALGYALLCTLAATHGATTQTTPPLVTEAIALIHQNYAEVYGVEELATQLPVSKSHLVRVFSASVGTSPGRYLNSVRIDAAKRLLLRREYPLGIIATLCGYSGANYLCKAFKKATGITPAVWRSSVILAGMPAAKASEWEAQLYL